MSEGTASAVFRGYEAAATVVRIASWEAADNDILLRPVRRFLPPAPADLAEIGAGTGRTAAWLAGEDYNVTAVEPVAALRDAGMTRHADQPIHWIDDRLPRCTRWVSEFSTAFYSSLYGSTCRSNAAAPQSFAWREC